MLGKGQGAVAAVSGDKGPSGPNGARRRYIDLGGIEVHLLGCVKGLLSEGDLVEAEIRRLRPALIGLHIGGEELRGLEAVLDGEISETDLSSYEKLYAIRLSRFGEVQVPPPSLVQALRSARELKLAVEPLDMDDEEYSAAYTRNVNAFTMLRQSLRMNKVGRIRFDDPDPCSFAVHWDEVVNRPRGFRRLESDREHHFARRIRCLSGRGGPQMHVLEVERLEGVHRILSGTENPSVKIK